MHAVRRSTPTSGPGTPRTMPVQTLCQSNLPILHHLPIQQSWRPSVPSFSASVNSLQRNRPRRSTRIVSERPLIVGGALRLEPDTRRSSSLGSIYAPLVCRWLISMRRFVMRSTMADIQQSAGLRSAESCGPFGMGLVDGRPDR
jgi:hypothetical protein